MTDGDFGHLSNQAGDGGTPAIFCRGLRKTYGDAIGLHATSLSIEGGERVSVFGSNGAGKTTLIKILAGLLRPSAGSVRVLGRRPWGLPGSVRGSIGLVTHQSFLYEELNARENLRFYAQLYGVPDARNRIEEILATFELANRAREPVRSLSRGLQQRVALARAMVHEPEVLLLDEPDTGLDPSARQSLERVLSAAGKGLTAIIATHDVDLGLKLSDRSIILESGTVVHDSAGTDSHDSGAEREAIMRVLLKGSRG